MPALPSFVDHMMQLNPRSVLRPEYLAHSRVPLPNSEGCEHKHTDNRMNTNTAPLYSSENSVIRRKYFRDHPYSRTNSRSHDSSPQSCSANKIPPSTMHNPLTVPVKTSLSSPDLDGRSRVFPRSPMRKFASDLRSSRSESDVLVRGREDGFPSARSHTHGQSEQLRRSRESSTFALIDAQLSRSPLSQVRDMYLQTRSGSNPSSSSSASRTTKKVNLSVVHTIVRFRLKEYLHDIQDHTKRLLDTLFSNTFDDYHPEMRNELASKLFGISRLPCATDCQTCCSLTNSEIRVKHRDRFAEHRPSFDKPSVIGPCPVELTFRPFSSSSSNNSTTPMLTISDAPSESHDFSPTSNPKDEAYQDVVHTDSNPLGDTHVAVPVDTLADFNNIKLSPGQFCLPTDNSILEKPLLSYHMSCDPFEPKRSRNRLDSFTLRIVDEFGTNDWLADEIDIGPYGEDPVDLHTLVSDSACEGILKPEELLFGSDFEPIDIMHPFSVDRCTDSNHQ